MLVGQQLGPFTIEKELGSGAMGAVYLARYKGGEQRVAIKVMAPGLLANETAFARFEREAAVLKQLDHPNIVRFYAAKRFHDTPFYAMEYIAGEGLDKHLHRRGRFTWEEVVAIGKQICAALKHAHDQGIIHRDLKPSNLMMTRDGTIKLTDFGIAKDLDMTQLTSANCTVGTAAYMSPEQCRGERQLTHKSDLYSLGVLLYELLTGQKPFKAETTMDMFLAHVQGTFERPSRVVLDIPVWLDTLVCQLLEKDPAKRPFDAATVARALDQVAEKVTAQRSAGIEAAKARGGERPRGAPRPDDTDREAARMLLESTAKGRKKRKTRPIYQRGWFQWGVVPLAAVALVVVSVLALYEVFRPASPEQLFARAEKLITEGQREAARKGPIQEYLDRFADRTDAQAQQIHVWADEIDLATREQQMYTRRNLNLEPNSTAERDARVALAFEEEGNLDKAREAWQRLAQLQGDKDRSQHTWGLLGGKRLADLLEVEKHRQHLEGRVDQARLQGANFKPDNEAEGLAVLARRAEQFGDPAAARERWAELRLKYGKDGMHRVWDLLAAQEMRALKAKVPADQDEKQERLRLVQKWLTDTAKAEPDRVLLVAQEIVALYSTSTEPQLANLVNEARERIQRLSADRKR